jgi:hypothetical protein
MKKLPVVAMVVVLLGVAALVYASPYIALSRMRAAAEKRDAAELSEYVDYPAVRESLKAEVTAQISGDLNTPGGALRALGAAFASALVGPAVDRLVTPENLSLMLQGAPPAESAPESGSALGGVETETGYEDLSTFVATVSPRGSSTSVDLVLGRDGILGWRLTGVRLPKSWLAPPAALGGGAPAAP